MKRFNLYEQRRVFTSDPMEYIGHMTFDKGDLVDMEMLPPETALLLESDAKRNREENGDLNSPQDVFGGGYSNILFVEAENDTRFDKEKWS